MVIGVCTLELYIPESGSLKGKRHVIRSLKDRVRQRFNVSIAEVDENELWQRTVLGIACVSNDRKFANQVMDKILGVVRSHPEVRVIRSQVEYL